MLKATAKNKNQRYNSAQEMLDDLNTVFLDKRINEAKWQIDEADEHGKTIALAKVSKQTESKKPKNVVSNAFGISLIILAAISMVLIILLSSNWGEDNRNLEMIDITNMSVEQATQELAAMGLTITKTIYQITDDIDEGIIISSSPSVGATTEKGSGVVITVSEDRKSVV